LRFNIGKLTIYIKPKFSYLRSGGLCIYKGNMSINRRIIILLAGPMVTTIIASLLFEFVFFIDEHGFIKALVVVLFITSIVSLAVNLFPYKIRVKSSERLYYSDGYQIILLLENRHNYNNITSAFKFYDEGDFVNALRLLLKTEDKYIDESVFGLILSCYVQLKQYHELKIFNKVQEQKRWYEALISIDYFHLASADIKLKDYNEALINLDKAITLEPNSTNNISCFNNRGFVHNMLGNYELAKDDLNKAIFLDELTVNPYCSRAFANLKLGRPGEVLMDIEKALSINENYPYTYLIMGIYLFEKEDFITALQNFEKAKILDADTMWVDDYINKTNDKLKPAILPALKKRKAVVKEAKEKKPATHKSKKKNPPDESLT